VIKNVLNQHIIYAIKAFELSYFFY
jgi:hypothetical protein